MNHVFIGTYTRPEGHVNGQADGIYTYQFDDQTGKLTHLATTTGIINPSFLTTTGNGRYLYAISELSQPEEISGAVFAFAIDPKSGQLTLLNKQLTHGLAPCYVSLSATDKHILVANYGQGNVCLFPVGDDGRLAPAQFSHQHEGTGPHSDRQEAPHAHSIVPHPAGRFFFSADLGADKIYLYRLDGDGLSLVGETAVAPGSGPRHITFGGNGRYVYIIAELSSEIILFHFDEPTNQLTHQQSISTLPADYTGDHLASDLHVSPDGRYLYAANRGHDSLAQYAIDPPTGHLSLIGHTATHGQTPRNFAIHPSGDWLLVANQDSSTVVTFRLHPQTGQLSEPAHITPIPSPACLHFSG